MIAPLLALAMASTASATPGAVRMETSDGRVILRVLGAPLPHDASDANVAVPNRRTGLVVTLVPGADPAPTLARLVQRGAIAVSVTLRERGARLTLTVPAGRGDELRAAAAADPMVASVVPWTLPVLLNDDSIWVGQSYDTTAHSTPIFDHGVTGTGEVLAVYDTGVDPDMCYFELAPGAYTPAQYLIPPDIGLLDPTHKIVAYYVEPGASAYDPFYGHGTGVAGCMVGDDYRTPSTATAAGHDAGDGMAPNARLVVLDGGGGSLSPMAGDQTAILEQAYAAGARIQNHSWAGAVVNLYGPWSADFDEFVWRHEGMLYVNAAGNFATAADDASVIEPAVAKNLLAVGATDHGRRLARDLARFSSRGPAFDGRLKPDIVAPGVDNLSSQASATVGDDNCGIAPFAGTSFASPTAAGWAALVRQYLREGFLPSGVRTADDANQPTAALVKATMILSAVPLTGVDLLTGIPVDPPPSLNQGWGRPLLDEALYFAGDARRTSVLDLRNPHGLRAAAATTLTVEVESSTEPLDVVVAWTDPPVIPGTTPALVNDLDLVVVDPGGTPYLGNVWSAGRSVAGGAPDTLNNVEAVRIAAPAAGRWTVRVDAGASLGLAGLTGSDRQGFALAMSHAACVGLGLPAPAAPSLTERPGGLEVAWPASAALGYAVYRAVGTAPAVDAYELLAPVVVAASPLLDADVQCGTIYSYRLRAWDGCRLSAASPATSLPRTAPSCTVPPTFAGIADARPPGACGRVTVSWQPAASNCPCSTGIVYNVWASTTAPIDPLFTPPTVSCVAGTSIELDLGAGAGLTHFLVRAEDRVPGGAGVCGGVTDSSLKTLASVPLSPTRRVSLSDSFDAGRDLWRQGILGGLFTAWDLVDEPFAESPTRALVADDVNRDSDSYAELNRVIVPTADTLVSFWHTFDLEGRYDGGVIEISTDGGSSWLDAGDRLMTERYTDWLMTGPDNDILRPAFTAGGLGAMRETLVWLGDLVGASVRLRLRMLTDGGAAHQRWAIDDFQLHERDCPAPGVLAAAFSHTGSACVGVDVAFDATATYGGTAPYSFAWDFGDATGDIGATVSHAYAAAGDYAVTLTVTDGVTAVDVIAMPVHIVAEVAAPDLGNVLTAWHTRYDVVLNWTEPPGLWPVTEVRTATARDLSDLGPLARVPWDQPREHRHRNSLLETLRLRLYELRLLSTCLGSPGP